MADGISASKKSSLRRGNSAESAAVAGERADLDRLGREHPDDPSRRRLMRPEHGERVGFTGGCDGVQRLVARSPFLPHSVLPGHGLAYGQLIGANGAFQISFAYSEIVRSDENQPTLAVFRMLERIHRLRSRQASSILICVAQ